MSDRAVRAARAAGVARSWRRLDGEQRLAGVAAVLVIVSTLGPFSFVEAAEVLVGVGVLVLLRQRAEGRRFHLPFGDGIAIAAAGGWSAVLILTRMLDRPPGQTALALLCALLLLAAGLREHSRRPPDDVPDEDADRPPTPAEAGGPPPSRPAPDAPTAVLPRDEGGEARPRSDG